MTDIMAIVGPCGSCGAPNIRLHESRRFLIDASTGVPHECAIPSRGGPFSSTAFGGELKVEVSAPVGNISPPDANGVRAICLGYHPEQNEYEWLRVVPESQLLDVCKERDRLAAIHHQDIETIVAAARDIATIQAQLTEARTRSGLLNAECHRLKEARDSFHEGMRAASVSSGESKIEIDRLRSSREQSIAAIEALGIEKTLNTEPGRDSSQRVSLISKSAVLSILRGAE